MESIDDVFQYFIESVTCQSVNEILKTDYPGRTHMQAAIGIRWAIMQNEEGAFGIFPLKK